MQPTDRVLKSSTAAAAVLAGVVLAGCTSEDTTSAEAGSGSPAAITVVATDAECELSATTASTGPSTFVITNNGTKATEFYVYGEGQRVVGEVENISPGLQRKLVVNLTEPGTYHTACKPGMVGDGIRGDFVVAGQAVQLNTDAGYQKAASDYKRYVTDQAEALVPATEAFASAIRAGDVAKAKGLYPTTRTYYERIEPVAESFPNDLDPRIDLREADLQEGQVWTGFHRLEKDLWVSGLRPDSAEVADQLVSDVTELAAGVKSPQWTIDPIQVAGGAQELLDEVAASKISGEEDIFSHTDLWDFNANLEGAQTAVASVRPILDQRNPDLSKRIDQRFAEVEALLAKYRSGDGFVLYTSVTDQQRQELSRAIDALSKEVSQVQGAIAFQ
ncbi:MAG: iron uptake system protein EfeO [Mycobacterium sp.]|nr:iron uptake system protein EfeO [Mycobacterium sp.]